MKKIGRITAKILGWIIGIVLLILIILQFAISPIATKTANKILAEKGSIEKIQINLLSGKMALKNVVLNQPEGYEAGEMVVLSTLAAKVRYLPLLRKKISLSYFDLNGLETDIQKQGDNINLMAFAESFSGPKTDPSTSSSENDKPVNNPELYIKRVNLDDISLKFVESNDSTIVQDITVKGLQLKIKNVKSKGLRSLVKNVILSVKEIDVKMFEAETENHLIIENLSTELINIFAEGDLVKIPQINVKQDSLYLQAIAKGDTTILNMIDFGLVVSGLESIGKDIQIEKVVSDSFEVKTWLPDEMEFHLTDLFLLLEKINILEVNQQPTEFTLLGKIKDEEKMNSSFGVYGLTTIYQDKFPVIDAVLKVIGLELEQMKGLMPPGTYQALGGDAFDLSAQLSASETKLDCKIDIDMIQGSKLGMSIGGTPEKPELDTSSVLFNVFSRFGGGIGSSLSKVGGTTFDAAKAGLNTAYGVGKGATNVVGSVGKGLFKTVKGVVTLDAGELGEGLKTTTLGSVAEVGKAVMDTGGNIMEGTGDALSSATGKTAADKWRLAKQARWDSTWTKAVDAVREKK